MPSKEPVPAPEGPKPLASPAPPPATEADREMQRAREARFGYVVADGTHEPFAEVTLNGVRYVRACDPAAGPATEANAWFRLEDRVPEEGKVVLLARYSGSDTDYDLRRYFRPDHYGPGRREWWQGWRWAMVVEPPCTPRDDAG